jgi:hypothetical protein
VGRPRHPGARIHVWTVVGPRHQLTITSPSGGQKERTVTATVIAAVTVIPAAGMVSRRVCVAATDRASIPGQFVRHRRLMPGVGQCRILGAAGDAIEAFGNHVQLGPEVGLGSLETRQACVVLALILMHRFAAGVHPRPG